MLVKPFRSAGPSGSTSATLTQSAIEEHTLVQVRLELAYGVLAAIVLGLWAVFAVSSIWWSGRGLGSLLSLGRLGHLATALALLAARAACRTRPRSRLFLATLDLGGMFVVVSLVALAVASVPGVHLELITVIAVTLMLSLRAALVPTPPRWTLCVAAVAAIPAPIGTWLAVARDPSWNASRVPQAGFVVVAAAWTVAAVLSSGAIAKVVYGLRSEIKDAMRLGPYTLEEKIGEGGMGVVYRARHALLRRPTAVKLLAPDRTEPSSVWRFEREVQITSGLTHPNTVAIYDFGRTRDGVFYYAMELLEGTTLQELVERGGPQPFDRVVHILVQIAGALAEAHRAGLVHRDVKPANVFLCERGGIADFVKVLDFGLVKDLGVATQPGFSHANAIKGTPHFMAPETVTEPDTVDARADIYSLGVLAYHLVTGQLPFEGGNIVEICSQHLYVVPTLPSHRTKCDVDPDLERLIMRCLEKRPADRPSTAEEIVEVLERLSRSRAD